MNELLKQTDFHKIGLHLQNNNNYLNEANRLSDLGEYRIIHDSVDNEPYLHRYYYFNFRPFARLVIHRFEKSDVDGLHDHPWPFATFILSGGYWEHNVDGKHWRGKGYMGYADANYLHRVELDPEKAGEDTWTLFMMGQKEREWGFIDKTNTWVPHYEHIKALQINE